MVVVLVIKVCFVYSFAYHLRLPKDPPLDFASFSLLSASSLALSLRFAHNGTKLSSASTIAATSLPRTALWLSLACSWSY